MEMHVVESLPSFLELAFSLNEKPFYHEIADLKVMYRGQSNASWGLFPAAFRDKDDFLNEHLYIREYERIMPDQCTGKNSIEIMIDAQHYGIPTRLLDVTTNPLVALYFACADCAGRMSSNDGIVFQFLPAGVFLQDDPLCTAIAEYVRRYKDGIHFPPAWKEGLIRAVTQTGYRFPFDPNRTVESLLSENPDYIFFLPKYRNGRIQAQNGAFLLGSTPFVKQNDPGYGDGIFLLPDNTNQYENMVAHKYIIPSESKSSILSQLDCVGINEALLFPDIEHIAHSIVTTIRSRNHAKNQRV